MTKTLVLMGILAAAVIAESPTVVPIATKLTEAELGKLAPHWLRIQNAQTIQAQLKTQIDQTQTVIEKESAAADAAVQALRKEHGIPDTCKPDFDGDWLGPVTQGPNGPVQQACQMPPVKNGKP